MELVLKGAVHPSPRRWIWPILVFAVCLAVYLPVGRSGGSGDTLPARLVAISLLTEGDFDLDEFGFARDESAVARFPQMGGVPYYLRKRGASFYSAYTVAPAVLAVPVFAPFVLAGLQPDSARAAFVEKLAASLMVALSAAALFVVSRRRLELGFALFLTAIYAFGTSSFSTSAGALWQHGPGQLCLALALLWMDPEGRGHPILSALALGGAVAMRNTNALVALPLGVWLLVQHREHFWKMGLAAAALPLALLAYYLAVFGAPGPEYENIHMGLASGFRQIPLSEGLFGVLVSPMRGLFTHSPVLLLAFVGVAVAIVRRDRFITVVFVSALAVVPLVAKWFVWWGGHCFGPRLLSDAMPLWVLALSPALCLEKWPGKLLRGIALSLGMLSIGIGTLGAALYDGRHDAYAFTDLRYENLMRGGGGPTAFYASELLTTMGLRGGAPTDLGPLPRNPANGPDGRPIPQLGDPVTGKSLLRAIISDPTSPRGGGPTIGIELEKAHPASGEPLRAVIRTENPARPHAVNGWFVIEDAEGGLWNLQGGSFAAEELTAPRPWTGNSPLPYDVRIDLVETLPPLPPGRHRLHFAITDCANTRIESRADAVFQTGPRT